MPAAFTQRLRSWREWELNPVVVKELRQAVRSWAVTGMLLLFLAVLFCTSLAFLVSQSFSVNVNQRLGAQIFQVFTGILSFASMLFIPLYVGVRLAAERQENNLDLLYITTLTPERIIRGKFLCGAYMTVLFFSACMPFMAFTNLLRGVDLPTVAFILVCLFLAVCCAIQVGIFVACLPVGRVLKILVALFGTAMLFPLTAGLIGMFIRMMQSGIGSMMGGGTFWIGFSTSVGVILAGVVLLYYLSVAMISPLSANRAVPLRSYVTVLWLMGAALCVYWTLRQQDARLMLPWGVVTFAVLTAAILVVVSNSDELSLRVRRRIPVHPVKRAVAFLFFNGAAGGLVWSALLMGVTCVVTLWLLHKLPQWRPGFKTLTGEDLDHFFVVATGAILYVFAYALTALFIHRQLFHRRSARLAGILAVLLAAGWALIPKIILFFLNHLSFRAIERLQLGDVINLFLVKDYDDKVAHVICAGLWLLVMLILNARWFARRLNEFQPPEQTAPAPSAPAAPVPPSLPTPTGVLGT